MAEKKRSQWQKLTSTLGILIVAAAVGVLMATLWFPVYRIHGRSMTPTVNEGEIVLAVKGGSVAAGDVVALRYGDRILMKRVIATAGETVDIDADGTVTVNGERLAEPYVKEKVYGSCNIKLPLEVPEGRLFVMGDNRELSSDSRNSAIGCVEREQIAGRVVWKIWPLRSVGVVNREARNG